MSNEQTDEKIDALAENRPKVWLTDESGDVFFTRASVEADRSMRQAEQEPVALQQMAVVEGGVLRMSDDATLTNLIAWVDSRIEEEVAHRPDVNIHKRTLSGTWNQVRRHLVSLQSEPAHVQPLTDEQVRAEFAKLYSNDDALLKLAENNRDYALEAIGARHHWAAFNRGARAIEKAYGIGEKNEH